MVMISWGMVQGEPKAEDIIVPEMTDKEYEDLNEQEVVELPAK